MAIAGLCSQALTIVVKIQYDDSRCLICHFNWQLPSFHVLPNKIFYNRVQLLCLASPLRLIMKATNHFSLLSAEIFRIIDVDQPFYLINLSHFCSMSTLQMIRDCHNSTKSGSMAVQAATCTISSDVCLCGKPIFGTLSGLVILPFCPFPLIVSHFKTILFPLKPFFIISSCHISGLVISCDVNVSVIMMQ